MRHAVAVFSDIHSNYPAFRACYEDALGCGVDSFIFLGDYVSDLAEPCRTMDLVYEIRGSFPAVCLRGNRERYMLEREQSDVSFVKGSSSGSLLFTYEQLRPRDLAFFRDLKMYDTMEVGGVAIEVAHAAKEDDRYYFEKNDLEIQAIFSQMDTGCLLTGHTHRQYIAYGAGKVIMNPGSVGVPQGGDWRAAYGLLFVEDGQTSFQLRQVPYDIAETIHGQFASGLVEMSRCWGIGMLHDIIYGEERTLRLLEAVRCHGDVRDEEVWYREAARMGMRFSEEEILRLASEVCR